MQRLARILAVSSLLLALAAGCSGDAAPSPSPGTGTTMQRSPARDEPRTAASPSGVVAATAAATAPGMATATVQAATPTSTEAPRMSTPRAISSPGASPARVIDRGPAGRRFVALTFDAGADAGYTASILETLRRYGVTASFSITGRWGEAHPELLRRIVNEGHHVMNHTYDHSSFTGLSTRSAPLAQARRWEQLDRAEAAIRAAGGEGRPYFRPPYGDYDATVNADAGARGYAYNIMWTVDSMGWNGLPAGDIVTRCLRAASPGAIYVFHVGAASQDALALAGIIEGLRQAGYGLGSVPDLLGQ